VLETIRPDCVLNQNAFPVLPTGRIAPRSFPEIPTARALPALARTHSSENVDARRFTGEAFPVSPAVPTMVLAPSPTQFNLAPLERSNHSFATIPCRPGGAPVLIEACPGPVTV
jgi:hypothetical protein